MEIPETKEPLLDALFLYEENDLDGEQFAKQVLIQGRTQRRKTWLIRLAIGGVLALISIPLQDFALLLSEALMTALIETDGDLISQLLAPINSVASLLSILLIAIRLFHKRFVSRNG